MGQARYSNVSEAAVFGFLANALGSSKGDDGDIGSVFPRSDAEDLSKGARFIPGEVTVARRTGQKVEFVTDCSPNCWYWKMPDNTRIYHFDPETYRQIGKANGRTLQKDRHGVLRFKNGPGPCPQCGNVHTSGGTVQG